MKTDINKKQRVEKPARAKRADIDGMNERFEGILQVLAARDGDGGLSKEKVEVVKLIALGSTFDEVVLAAGRKILGIES